MTELTEQRVGVWVSDQTVWLTYSDAHDEATNQAIRDSFIAEAARRRTLSPDVTVQCCGRYRRDTDVLENGHLIGISPKLQPQIDRRNLCRASKKTSSLPSHQPTNAQLAGL